MNHAVPVLRSRSAFAFLPVFVVIAPLAILVGSPVAVFARARPKALESVRVPADGRTVSLMTSLNRGELFLLKATGTVKVGGDMVDAEYGGFGPRIVGQDVMGGTDVGVDVGVPALYPPPGAAPGRMHWFGEYRPDHTYYMIVNGAGQPLTLRLAINGAGPASGAITISVFRLSPAPAPVPKPLETVQVPVLEKTVTTSLTTRLSTVYLLQASGSGRVGGGGLAQGDAEYMDYRADGTGAVDIGDAHTDYGLGVDEADQSQSPRLRKWGPWRQDHTYYMLVAGTGRPLHFFYYDVKGGYGDNSPTDTLTVKVLPLP